MAAHDRFPFEPRLQTVAESDPAPQGELFGRLCLRQLPILKEGPEDLWIQAPRTLH